MAPRNVIRLAVLALTLAGIVSGSAYAFAVNEYPPPPDGSVGIPYKYVFTPKDGAPPYAFYFKAGDLPPGLKIETDGTFHGTPTQPGTFVFDIEATQYCGFNPGCPVSQRSFTVKVRDRLTITTTSLRSATLGAPYSQTISVTGNGGLGLGWSISSGSLPPGLTIAKDGSPADTTISGTPTAAGTYSFTVKVGDTDGFLPDRSTTKQLTLAVVTPLTAAAGAPLPTGVVGRPYRATPVTASGGLAPYTWSVSAGALPPGLALDQAGALAGTPAAPGSFAFTVSATDADGRTAAAPVTVTVVRALDLLTTRLRDARAGKPYRVKLRSLGGQAPLRWRVSRGKLPAGLRLDAGAGVITGKPKQAGTAIFTVAVTDALGQRSSERLRLTVRA